MKKLFLLFAIVTLAFSAQAQQKKMHQKKMEDCVMMKDGKMMQSKDGNMMDMTQDMTMKNGTMVMTDGTVKMKSGKTMKLKEGDCVMMSGNITHMGMKKGTMKHKHTMKKSSTDSTKMKAPM
ncbi:MAG: D-lyxose/D-mannose family sugar isomerase [Flavisolibacter sp.]